MTTLYAPDITDKFTTQLIRRTAQMLVSDGFYPSSDLDDVIQEIGLALFQRADKFDPKRARWSTFVKMAVRSAAATLRRKQRADFRQAASEVASLNVMIPDEDDQLVDMGATIGQDEYHRGQGRVHVSHADQVDRTLDVRTATASLPAELQEIAVRLERQSVREMARELNVSRTTLNRRIAEIQAYFCRAGLAPNS